MPTVYKFPPVDVTAYENTINDPMRTSTGINGAARFSQIQANRAIYVAQVSGIGADGNGTGYVEALKQLLKGKLPLVQVDTLPAVWWAQTVQRGPLLSGAALSWTASGVALDWEDGSGTDVEWYTDTPLKGTHGNDGLDYIDIVGLPSGVQIFPGEAVQVGGSTAFALRPTTVGEGATRIYLTEALPSGHVDIGAKVTRMFRMVERARATQVPGAFSYTFDMIEIFATDFAEALTVVDPWN